MAHEKKSVRRKIASQVSSAQGGQTSRKQSGGELSNLARITGAAIHAGAAVGKKLSEVKATDFIPGGAAIRLTVEEVRKSRRKK